MLQRFSFHQRSLATRLTVGFGVMLALVLGIALTGVAALLHGSQSQARTVQAIDVQHVTRALLLEVTLDDIRTLAIVRSAGMPEVADRFKPDMQASAPRVRQLLKDLATTGTDVIRETRSASLAKAHDHYVATRDKVLKLVESGQTIEATAAETSLLAPARDAWRQGVSALAADMDTQAQQSLAQASSLGDLAVRVLIVLALVAVTTGLLWARAISTSIARPILKAARLSGAIAEGDLIEKPEMESGLAHEGGEPGVLLRALLTMRDALAAMSRNTAQSAATVSTASESMALSAQSLAIRTEDQTRSVITVREQVEQVAQGIQQTAEMASAGEQQCLDLQAATSSGQEAARKAVDTIEQVAQRSMAMYEVVSLIESIAFQINILSLNAAVEAARAGTAGAGFAVVATEVRTLAKRAADSVQTIRQQIHGAAEHMQSGVQSVNTVEHLLRDMHGMVSAVAERARDISEDTHRQTTALALASKGLGQLAVLNAANTEMVVSTVHGCEDLRAEAKLLLERIAQMRFHPATDDTDTPLQAARPALPQTAQAEFF